MIQGMFTNGNRRIARLVLIKLAWATIIMVLIQVQGYLPTLDFVSPVVKERLGFAIAILLTVSKGGEMFFDKTIQLLKNHEISFDTQEFNKPPGSE